MRGPVLINPVDWQEVRLLRTADGIYIWGNPSEAGPERIWGQQVVKAQAMPEGTALVGDFANFSELATKAGIELKMSDSHSDFFVKGKLALRASFAWPWSSTGRRPSAPSPASRPDCIAEPSSGGSAQA